MSTKSHKTSENSNFTKKYKKSAETRNNFV